LFSIILIVCSKDEPTIETTDVQIKETHSGLLHCNASSNPVSVITWRNEDRAVDITEGLVKGENTLSLHFTAVTREDAGRYRCSANNGIGDVVSKDANIIVICKNFVIIFDREKHLRLLLSDPMCDIFAV